MRGSCKLTPDAVILHTLHVAIASVAVGSQQPAAGPAPEFVPIAGLVQIVNDDAITATRLDRRIEELQRRRPVTTAEEFEQLVATARRLAIDERLQTQAGENLGIDAKEVEARAKSILERRKEKEGLQSLAESLREQGLSAGGAQQNMRDLAYQATYYFAETGEWPGVRGRVWRDTYVRPGELHYAYEESKPKLAEPDRVVLQLLDLSGADHGGLEKARAAAISARSDIVAGHSSFDDSVDELSQSRADRGVQPEIAVDRITQPELRAFARTATEGQLSEPMPWVVEGAQRGWRVAKLVGRRQGKPAPSFMEGALQQQLRKSVQTRRKELWLEESGLRMVRGAWVWPRSSSKRPAVSDPNPAR